MATPLLEILQDVLLRGAPIDLLALREHGYDEIDGADIKEAILAMAETAPVTDAVAIAEVADGLEIGSSSLEGAVEALQSAQAAYGDIVEAEADGLDLDGIDGPTLLDADEVELDVDIDIEVDVDGGDVDVDVHTGDTDGSVSIDVAGDPDPEIGIDAGELTDIVVTVDGDELDFDMIDDDGDGFIDDMVGVDGASTIVDDELDLDFD